MQDAFAHCEALVRAADKDRFLAALFAPQEHRAALFALYAFNIEIARVREVIHDPLSGEIRLQWWTDVLAGVGRGEVASNPIAAALLDAKARYGLAAEPFRDLIEARRFDLYDESMRTLGDLEAYGRNASSRLIELAARILGGDREPGGELVLHAGIGYAIAGLLKAFPIHAARGQLYLPLDLLQRHGASREDALTGRATAALRAALTDLRRRAREQLSNARDVASAAPAEIMPALLPVALARPMLDRMERADYDPFVPVDIPQWRRQWLLWRAARRPSRIFG
jgi:phytoene synthase